jgi:hypothetical protein
MTGWIEVAGVLVFCVGATLPRTWVMMVGVLIMLAAPVLEITGW